MSKKRLSIPPATNIQDPTDAYGTPIFYVNDVEGRTAETSLRCIKEGKPLKLIDGDEISVSRASDLSASFIRNHGIHNLNVAGPRASKAPRA